MMSKIIFFGWKKGLKKISLSQYLMKRFGYRLEVAKEMVDKLLEGQEIVITVCDVSASDRMELDDIGVLYRVIDE